MDHDPSRSGREGTLCQSQTGFGGPLSASVGYFRQSARGAVSPRSLQPVPLESVLGPRSLWQNRIGIEPSQWLTSETNFPGRDGSSSLVKSTCPINPAIHPRYLLPARIIQYLT